MPWPAKVVRQFEKVPANPSEADFHGPYNKLLYTLFPPDTDFMVDFQYVRGPWEAADLVFMFEVVFEDKPVFILELKPPGHLRYPSMRKAADRQIRSRIRDLCDNCPLPVLHAVSAFGTRLCFYRKPQGRAMEPPSIAADPELETDTAPRERWDCDILEEEGARRFQAVVEEIKQACAAL
ncbi:uncharacterized protein LAESUDRAFT_724020 [Laetiporus sulphureus 93-53]|uniref:Fungal-type protein kinase domain-containing protein n=1 Tax=Laetiporus sulphureus 93-53 TaxID=1314785 RepID=A0A165F727_9APHY|nr:uncharacterized protein LAESUDRAFT_724020 [Laetiporus sulphureus 93-53]KZT08512.1 hypothetical protein LAESUDRAFT_724020 [Laetiporus sulphureus 93-53]